MSILVAPAITASTSFTSRARSDRLQTIPSSTLCQRPGALQEKGDGAGCDTGDPPHPYASGPRHCVVSAPAFRARLHIGAAGRLHGQTNPQTTQGIPRAAHSTSSNLSKALEISPCSGPSNDCQLGKTTARGDLLLDFNLCRGFCQLRHALHLVWHGPRRDQWLAHAENIAASGDRASKLIAVGDAARG